ncbi:MAG TPA: M1 family aminopeptidase [Thermoanaerobaculia bacterium]|jgi:hypothetical protein
MRPLFLAALAAASLHAFAAAPVRYDMDVTITPAERGLAVAGTLELPAAGAVELRLRDPFVLTSTDGPVEKLKTEANVTTWRVTTKSRLLHFAASASKLEKQSLLHVDADGAFTTANEMPWYPVIAGTNSIGVVRYHAPPDMVIAAAGVERRRGEFAVDVPLLFWFAAARYRVVNGANSTAYLLTPRPDTAANLRKLDAILAALANEFGPYPYGRFKLIEISRAAAVDAGGFNAFGSAGAIVSRSSAFDVPLNVAYYAHEVGHQWWSNLVSLRFGTTRGNYLLDEALAQYASMTAVEALEGEAAAERYRRSGYPGFHDDLYCYCAPGYLRMNAAGLDRPLAEMPDDVVSDRLSRSKGGWMWLMLRDELGRERFRTILREITRTHAFGGISWDEFVAAVQRGAGRDVSWFFDQWVERSGAPEFTLAWTQANGRVQLVVTQPPPFFRAPLEVELRGAEKSLRTVVDVSGGETRVEVPADFEVLAAELDPHYRILRWTPELRLEAAAAAPYFAVRQALTGDDLGPAETLARNALANVPSPDRYAARFFADYSLAMLAMKKKEWRDAATHLERAIDAPTRHAETLPFVYLRYATALKELGDVEGARRAIDNGRSAASAAAQPARGDAEEALENFVKTLTN